MGKRGIFYLAQLELSVIQKMIPQFLIPLSARSQSFLTTRFSEQ
jgi:hypothetical protein